MTATKVQDASRCQGSGLCQGGERLPQWPKRAASSPRSSTEQ